MRSLSVLLLAFSLVACGGDPQISGGRDLAVGPNADLRQVSDGGVPAADLLGAPTTIRVHYPAGSRAVTIRGSGAPLDWTHGQTATSTASDTSTFTLPALSAPIEWKPLLDDQTWARGPNYHVSPGQTVDVYPHFSTAKGKVVTLIANFSSTNLKNTRPIYAYLPASYDENPAATYPVVYLHDGQNLWAALPQLAFGATWDVDAAFDAATETGACSTGGQVGWAAQPLGGTATTCTGDGDCASKECRTFPEAILIGVANVGSARMYEYTPTTDPSYSGGGGGDVYLKMLVEELKPQVDQMLRTRPERASTTMAGSSLGGLISSYGGIGHSDTFGLVGAFSPSTWWNDNVLVTDVKATAAAPKRPLRVYVDSGTSSDGQADTDLLAGAYLGLGYKEGVDFRHVVQPGASHKEVYWAQRFPGAMQFLLGER